MATKAQKHIDQCKGRKKQIQGKDIIWTEQRMRRREKTCPGTKNEKGKYFVGKRAVGGIVE